MTDTAHADLPLPLRTYMSRERDGHLSFSYAYETGVYSSEVGHIKQKLDEALRRRGADKTAALKEVQKFVDGIARHHDLLEDQWGAELERRNASRPETATVSRQPTRGGPTEAHPDAPYCKPDQSCCDFICGN